MPTLTIEGRRVTVGDEFLSMTPEQQGAAVEEIAGSLGIRAGASEAPADAAPAGDSPAMTGALASASRKSREFFGDNSGPPAGTYGGAAMNATAGANQGIYGVLGLPVDAAAGVMNAAIRGANYVTGSDLPTIDNPVGGSRSIAQAAGAVHPVFDPENTKARTQAERLVRAAGEGAGSSVTGAGVVGALARTGTLAARPAEMAAEVFGRSNSAGTVAREAAVSAAAGSGASAAAEAAPDAWKPAAALAAGIAAGGTAATATGIPGAVRGAARAAGDAVAPLTAGGRERLAAQQFRARTSNPDAALRTLDGETEIVSGSMPTTGQLTGDLGILAQERGASTRRPDLFAARRETQNAARLDALGAIQPDGATETVAAAFRRGLDEIDRSTQTAINDAWKGAQTRVDALGAGMAPETAGDALRGAYEKARAAAKEEERRRWSVVDPDGTLAAPVVETRRAATEIIQNRPRFSQLGDNEIAIYQAASGMGDVEPFSGVTELRSVLNDALRQERRANGESQMYRRLSTVRNALERDLDGAINAKADQDDAAVAAGRLEPSQALRTRIAEVSAPSVGDAVFTPSGRRVGVRYELAEGDSLITSNRADGRPDVRYPPNLQPRDRSRAASDTQIADIARNLQPERLGASTSAAEGAPIVGPDGIVESGNGRTLGIRRAYQEGRGQGYRDYLQGQGYDVAGFREPVLVRRRVDALDDAERQRFAQEANASSSLSMSASEQAATDASRMGADLLALYRGGDVSAAENRDFTRAFLRSVPDRGQEGSFVTGDGSLSLDGAQRMRNALLQSAYRDPRLVSALADEGDENIRAFGRALTDLSGDVARLRAGVDAGAVDAAADVSAPLVEAARAVQSARARNVRLPDALAQQDAFSRVSPEALQVLRIAYGDGLAGRLSRERLGEIMRSVIREAEQQTTDARLFGDVLDARSILEGAFARYGSAVTNTGQGRAPSVTNRTGGSELRQGPGGPGSLSDRPAVASDGRGDGPRVLAREARSSNFDAAARSRLSDASAATRDRANTFDNGTLAPLRRRPSTSAPYDVSSSAVAGRLFFPGPKSGDAIASYRRAVGDGEALRVMQDYAVDRLRNVALRPDGTFDPAKVTSWRRSHADALRAFPELDARFADAARASRAMEQVATARKEAMDKAQAGALGQIMKVDTPAEVSNIVGGLLTRRDAATQMKRLRQAIGDDKEAAQGLRKAVADYMTARLVGNTEVGTSGREGIKSDAFQTFVARNADALKAAGFNDREMAVLRDIAADLQRSNRSVAAVRNPGGSNTAQDTLAAGGAGESILRRLVYGVGSSVAGGVGGGLYSGLSGAVVGMAPGLLSMARQSGLTKVDDIVTDALLNPSRARFLLSRPNRQNEAATVKMLGQLWSRAAFASSGEAAEQMGERKQRVAR